MTIDATFRDNGPEGLDNFNVSGPKVINTLQIEERERRRKNYEAIRSMLVVVTGSDQWDAYTYSELIEGARNALYSELARIK
jgi:hypothetical protein